MTSPSPLETLDVPAEFALLAIDMEKYSQIPEAKMETARSDVDDILATVLAECQLQDLREIPDVYKDTGDGVILLFPPAVLARLVDPLLGRLNSALVRYERQRLASSQAVRLRASVHVGPVPLPRLRGGNAIVEVCRLLESRAVYQALSAASDSGAFLAAVLSETAYRRCVHGGYTPQLTHHDFLEALARVSNKPGFEDICRLHVPGLPAVALAPYITDASDPGPSAPAPPSPPPAPGSPAASAGSGGSFQFHAPLYDATVANTIEHLRYERPQR
ncbi:hypothetical protein ACFU76_23075 [Streptomyces sp. NPDC057539]|uniref:hypothetical protein n=1 Tax=Streptomyces sp. NPDC057539 TaxID=3346159 RepID=UPI0036B2EB9B